MNENIYVRLIVSETTWIRQEWVIFQTFQDVHEVLVPQLWSFAISVQCFFSISTLLISVLHHTTHLALAVLQTSLDRHPRAGMLCARQSKL